MFSERIPNLKLIFHFVKFEQPFVSFVLLSLLIKKNLYSGKDIRHIVYISLSLHKMSDLYISQFSLCKSLLSRMAQKLGPHIVQYSPSVTALSL